jgi:hypothetical protein
MKKLGTVPTLRAREFWRTLSLPVEWVEGEIDELLQAKVDGIFVNPDDSEALLPRFHEVPRQVVECQFFDFIEIERGRTFPRSFLRSSGSELFARGTKILDTKLRAYVTGTGPWARLFCLLAVEKGYSHLCIIVEKVEEAAPMLKRLSQFCFGVHVEVIEHVDLTLQPNNGSLLVNTISPEHSLDLISDLAYLNYLSPTGLVIETHETKGVHPLLEEARHSNLAVLDANETQGLAEYKAFTHYPGLLPWTIEEYLEKRKSFFS